MEIGHEEQSPTARLIWLVATPIVFTVGVIGNSITFAVFIKPKNSTSSTSIYFIWLAVADTLALLFELPRWWIIYIFQYDVRHASDLACKLWMFALVYASTLSTYVLLALTIERLISTVKPLHVKTICTPRNANIVGIGVLLCLIVFSGNMMYGWGLTYLPPPAGNQEAFNANMIPCNTNNSTLRYGCNSTDWNGMDSATVTNDIADNTSVGLDLTDGPSSSVEPVTMPTTLSSGSPFATSDKAVCTWYRDEKYILVQKLDDILQFFLGFLVIEVIMVIADVIIIYKLMYVGGKTKGGKQSGHIRQITITLVFVNIVFIICKTPMYIFLPFFNTTGENTKPETQEIVWAVVNVFFYTNHAVNFFLYVLIGTRFRRQVMEMLCWWKDSTSSRRSVVAVTGTSTLRTNAAFGAL